jgi:hypothetical protein
MSTTPAYDGLHVDQRLTIERLLYERMTGGVYAERSIPADASEKKREYLVSCIRDANHLVQEGPVPQHQINAVREFSARATQAAGQALLVTPADLHERIERAQAAAVQRSPFALESSLDPSAPAKTIPRRRIAEKALAPLGYQYVEAQSGSGTLSFTKTIAGGETCSCNFDFGSWRRTVLAIFTYSALGCRISLPLRYQPSGREAAIVDKELFEQTMANIAFVLREVEAVLT